MNRKNKKPNERRNPSDSVDNKASRDIDKPEPPPWMKPVLQDISEEALYDFVQQVFEERDVAQEVRRTVICKKTNEQILCITQLHRAAVFTRTYFTSSEKTQEIIFVATLLLGLEEVIKSQIWNNCCTPRNQIFAIVQSALHRLDEKAQISAWRIRHVMGWGLEDEVDLVHGLPQIQKVISNVLISACLKQYTHATNPRLQ